MPSFLTGRAPIGGEGHDEFEGHSGRIIGLAVTSDDKHLISASEGGAVNVWDIGSCQLLNTIFSTKGVIAALSLTLLPKVLPKEKSLQLHNPLGAQLRKFPITDFSSYSVTIPTARLQARLAVQDKEKLTAKELKAQPLVDKMNLDEADDDDQKRRTGEVMSLPRAEGKWCCLRVNRFHQRL